MGGSESPHTGAPEDPGLTETRLYASFGRRATAFLIDIFVVGLVIAFLPSSIGNLGGGTFFLVVLLAYTMLGSAQGVTPGKRALGLRVVNRDGEAPGLASGVIRVVMETVSAILFLGYLWMVWDKDKQTWHDKAAKTYVVRTEPINQESSSDETKRTVSKYRG